MDLVNVLNIPFTLKNVKLIWVHSAHAEDQSVNEDLLAETEIIESVPLDPDSRSKVNTPHELLLYFLIFSIFFYYFTKHFTFMNLSILNGFPPPKNPFIYGF